MTSTYLDRDVAIARIKAALKRRSGRSWSVTGGRGTAWGWIMIEALPRDRTCACKSMDPKFLERLEREDRWHCRHEANPGNTSREDRALLGTLLGLDAPIHDQGESIPSGSDYYEEYVDRAEGRTPTKHGTSYWD